eukprot:4984272-Prymnesium_polylepis.1
MFLCSGRVGMLLSSSRIGFGRDGARGARHRPLAPPSAICHHRRLWERPPPSRCSQRRPPSAVCHIDGMLGWATPTSRCASVAAVA